MEVHGNDLVLSSYSGSETRHHIMAAACVQNWLPNTDGFSRYNIYSLFCRVYRYSVPCLPNIPSLIFASVLLQVSYHNDPSLPISWNFLVPRITSSVEVRQITGRIRASGIRIHTWSKIFVFRFSSQLLSNRLIKTPILSLGRTRHHKNLRKPQGPTDCPLSEEPKSLSCVVDLNVHSWPIIAHLKSVTPLIGRTQSICARHSELRIECLNPST